MKILIAVTSYVSYRLIEGQISYLTSQGIEVYFTSTYNEKVKKAVENEGGIFYSIEMEREINLSKDLKVISGVYKLLKDINPDIVNVSTPKASLLFSLTSLFYGESKLIYTMRGLRSDTLKGLKFFVVKLTEWFCCRFADRVIVIAPSLKQYAVKKGILKNNKGVVIGKGSSNGINLERFTVTKQHMASAISFREENGISDDAIVFGYVGRLVEDKGIGELYEAFVKIKIDHPNVYLLLVGEIEKGNMLNSVLLHAIRNNSNVIHLDYTDQIESLFCVMDCFVLYSYREGFGNVSIEAAAMGLPVIASDIPGLKDTVIDNETGFLSQPRNTNDLYYKMLRLLQSKELRETFGKNGRSRVVRDFDRKLIWGGQLEIYKSIFGS